MSGIVPYRVPAIVTLETIQGSESLVFSYTDHDRLQTPSLRMLTGFRRLVTAPGETILRFAREFGVLTYPTVPTGSFETRPEVPKTAFDEVLAGQRTREGQLYESTATWRDRARRVDAILSVAAVLRAQGDPTPSDWKALGVMVPIPHRRDFQRRLLIEQLDLLLWLANVRPTLRWNRENSSFEIAEHLANLSGAIGLLLIEALAGSHLRICAWCKEVFIPSRAHRKFCPRCGSTGAAHRLAVRKYDQKTRK